MVSAWLIGNGEVSGTDQANTYVLVANTADRAGEVTLSRLGDDGADSYHVLRTVALAPKSRTTIDLRSLVPPTSAAEWFGVLLESSGDDPVPIVVERATYGSPGGVFWGRGGNALATPLP